MSASGALAPFESVTRVHTDNGSHIEPPLNQDWSELDKLRWHAAVVEADTGVLTQVVPSQYWISGRKQDGYFDLGVGGSSVGPMRFWRAVAVLVGVDLGVRAARAAAQDGAS